MGDLEQSNLILRSSRTPRNRDGGDEVVRESLLSDSTSGIDKGEYEDTTSVGSNSFSSPDTEDNKERVFKFDANDIQYPNKIKGREFKNLDSNRSDSLEMKITENPTNTELSNLDIEQEEIDKVRIPDGGWGWIVVLSSFIISMIADGISFSFGLLYIEFLEEFQASKSVTAWIGSLFIAVPLLSGPVMSALVDRYGCRSMTILGGIVSTLGFVLASISNSIETMMITFGVIAGLGLGLVYVTAVVSIAYWFEKKRNLAVGLGACGTGVGTFVYAPMTRYFIEEYGWRGTILLLSGTLLNLCVCGCVMRDPEWWILEQKKEKEEGKFSSQKNKEEYKKPSEEERLNNQNSASVDDAYDYFCDATTRGQNMKGLIHKGLDPEKVIRFEAACIRRRQNFIIFKNKYYKMRERSKSLTHLPTYLTYSDKISMAMLTHLVTSTSNQYGIEVKFPLFVNETTNEADANDDQQTDNDPPVVTYPKRVLKRTHSDKYNERKEKTLGNYQLKNQKIRPILKKSQSETKEENKELVKQVSWESKREWLKKQLSVNHHYLRDLKMPVNSISHRNAMLNIKKYRLKASSCPDIFKNSMITINDKEEKWYDDCVDCLGDMFNVSLFKKSTFNLFCLGTIILFIWFIVPYFYLAEHMIHENYSEDDGAFMLSLIGITNTIGMVSLGWIGDFPRVSIGNLYAVCLVLCGASVAAIPPAAAFNYWALASISAAFGLLFAASFTFTPSLLVKLVSLDDFTTAYGLVLLAQGIGHLIGPPLSGLIYDLTLSWELSFYLAGGWIVVAGLLISLIQPIKTMQERREREAESHRDSIA